MKILNNPSIALWDVFDIFSKPRSWSNVPRRIFLIGLPFTWIIWLIGCFILLITLTLLCFLDMWLDWFKEMWKEQ